MSNSTKSYDVIVIIPLWTWFVTFLWCTGAVVSHNFLHGDSKINSSFFELQERNIEKTIVNFKLTLYTLTSVFIFSILFAIHFVGADKLVSSKAS